MAGSPHSASHYVKIWGILLGLLIISIVGPMLGHPIITLITAFGIAAVKAFLVMKHFMHLDVERPIVWYALGTSVAFMVLLYGGVAPDVQNHEGARWENVAAKEAVQHGLAEGEHGGGHGSGHGEGH